MNCIECGAPTVGKSVRCELHKAERKRAKEREWQRKVGSPRRAAEMKESLAIRARGIGQRPKR
jgi:hypothetical protein